MKIGIHERGIVFVGIEAIGEALNNVSRLEGDTEKDCFSISEIVYRDIKNKSAIQIDNIKNKNMDVLIEAFQVNIKKDKGKLLRFQ